jgi:D-mannonate dehydratase
LVGTIDLIGSFQGLRMMPEKRLTFAQLVDRVFWLLLIGISTWGVKELAEMSESIQSLNVNMAVVVQQIEYNNKILESHETRIREIEHWKKR